jgi:hypothetical protein
MHDNARPHIAQIVNEYLDTVEHVWDMVGRRVKVRTPTPANLRDLSAAVIQEWQEIDQAVIQDLFEGMPRRMEAVMLEEAIYDNEFLVSLYFVLNF